MSPPIQRILVHLDGTEQTVTAAQYAICLAAATGADLSALYVVNTRAVEDLLKARIFLQDEQLEYQRDMEADAQRYLDYVRDLADKKGVPIRCLKSTGSVHREILRVIDEQAIDLLVLGELSHIRSRRDEFYDESERAMRRAPCSVLIVKDDERVWDLYEALV